MLWELDVPSDGLLTITSTQQSELIPSVRGRVRLREEATQVIIQHQSPVCLSIG